MVMAEMERLTVTWEERWAGLLGEAEVDVARRCVALAAEAARVADNATLSAPQKQAILADRYVGKHRHQPMLFISLGLPV